MGSPHQFSCPIGPSCLLPLALESRLSFDGVSTETSPDVEKVERSTDTFFSLYILTTRDSQMYIHMLHLNKIHVVNSRNEGRELATQKPCAELDHEALPTTAWL